MKNLNLLQIAIAIVLLSCHAMASPDSTLLNISSLADGKNTTDGENTDNGSLFTGTPSLITGGDIILLPSLQVSFQDVWLHWSDNDNKWFHWTDKSDNKKHNPWKHKFSASISLNGEIDPDNNTDLVQKFMLNGGNVNIGIKLEVSAFGQANDSLSLYLFGDYSYLDTMEFVNETETNKLNLETAIYGLGMGIKFVDQFYFGWKGGRMTVLGNEDNNGAFFQSIDNEISQRIYMTWALDKTDKKDLGYIQFFRAWGANNVSADIGISFSKSFNINI